MRTTYASHGTRVVTAAQGPQLVRWGSVFSGTIIAIAVFALLDALWLALSFASHFSVVYSNLSWWIAGTAIFCMFLAGLVAGVTSGARGVAAGSMGGLTTWGLIVIGVALVVLPTFGIGHVPNSVTAGGRIYSINYLTYWTSFWGLVIGLGASLVGGMTGGAVQRSVDGAYLDLQRAEVQATSPGPAVVAAPAGAATPVGATTATVPVVSADGAGTMPVVYERQLN
ncbi:MAG TPA: hypothetical protein VL984_02935 [Acidimicrobiales bacterium]|nr:hypothetical protein [Acidimicrobiales bacterium]